jgi:hypothetical protein
MKVPILMRAISRTPYKFQDTFDCTEMIGCGHDHRARTTEADGLAWRQEARPNQAEEQNSMTRDKCSAS